MSVPEGDTPYDSWGRISEAQQYVAPAPYIAAELSQLGEGNIPFSGVPNYMDVSMMIWQFVTPVYRCVASHCITMRMQS
jgi:hypothetical protein